MTGEVGDIKTESNEAYGTTGESGKIPNPMYEMVDGVTEKRERRKYVTTSGYEDLGLNKAMIRTGEKCEDEYVTIMSGPIKPINTDT